MRAASGERELAPPVAATKDGDAGHGEVADGGSTASKRGGCCDTWQKIAVWLVFGGLVVYVIVDSLTTKHVSAWVNAFLSWVKDGGAVAPIAFTAVYAAATVAFVPGSVLTLGSGFVFAQAYGQGRECQRV